MTSSSAVQASRFGSRDFRALVIARVLFIFASQMQAIVIGWQVYAMTNWPIALGLVGLAEAIPALSLALYAGWLVDRGEPRVIYCRVLSLSLVSTFVLLITAGPSHTVLGSLHLYAFYVTSMLTGFARAFSQPAIYAMVPRLVEREELARASAWMSTSLQIARVAGPAIGGILYGVIGTLWSISLCGLIYVGALIAMRYVRATPHAPGTPQVAMGGGRKEELLSGLKFVFGHSILLSALSLDMFSVLFGGISAVLPIYAKEILVIGPKGLGALRAAPALGSALGGFLLTRIDIRPRAGTYLLVAIAGYGLAILLFSASHTLWLSLAALGFSGLFDSVSFVIRTVVVQLASPEGMRGRISAVNSMFVGSSNEIGEFESGIAASLMGTVPSVVFGACACLTVVSIVSYMAPALRRLDVRTL